MMVAKQWLSVRAAAVYSCYSERTIRRALRDFDADPDTGLRYERHGRMVRTNTEWIDDWMRRRGAEVVA